MQYLSKSFSWPFIQIHYEVIAKLGQEVITCVGFTKSTRRYKPSMLFCRPFVKRENGAAEAMTRKMGEDFLAWCAKM